MRMRATVTVQGVVQGVGFRPFVHRLAFDKNLQGFVRNQGDSTVLIVIQGIKQNVENFLVELESKKPHLAEYWDIGVEYANDHLDLTGFQIIESTTDQKNHGSVIPPDAAICEKCLQELHDIADRRSGYFLISCNDCGPRFTLVNEVPYDRQRTVMNRFTICSGCQHEYATDANRRFHNQTISCKSCGPIIFLTGRDGNIIESGQNVISRAAEFIEEGKIVAVKGIGGFHIVTSALNSEPISRLRGAKDRSSKPFAVMARNINHVRSFATLTDQEARILSSHRKPIVLLRKNENYFLSPLVAPGLQNVGVMLPYTAVHHLLFDSLKYENILVMTSANISGTPIVHNNNDALKSLSGFVDYFLMHDRDIANRCDDSVIQVSNNRLNFVRRSRGYVPRPINLQQKSERCIVGLGAEQNVTACVILNDKAFFSQHIGDVDTLETYLFLKESINHLLKITNAKPQLIVSDLHPTLNTTRLAAIMAEEMKCKTIQIQHHYAHVASLMAEHHIDEIVGIVCDGVGYGQDGKIWGGEVLLCNSRGYSRVGGLANQPMIGGDRATNYPLIMAAGILGKILCLRQLEDFLTERSEYLPKGRQTIDFIHKQLEKRQYVETSSTGRILDAISAILGVCYKRTYEGEPAMKLAASASCGHDVLNIQPKIADSHIDTTYLMQQIYESRQKFKASDLAYSAESYLAQGMAAIAIEHAKKHGIEVVGFSGGVAYNEHIASTIKNTVEQCGLKFVMNNKAPAGDGGVSLGQAYAASNRY